MAVKKALGSGGGTGAALEAAPNGAAPVAEGLTAGVVDGPLPAVKVEPAKPAATAQPKKDTAAAAAVDELEDPLAETAGEALKGEGKTEGTADDAAPAYEFTLPEGYEVAEEQRAEFAAVLGKHQATPELAQDLVNLMVARDTKMQQAQQAEFRGVQEGWLNDVKNDPEIGGAQFGDTKRLARAGAMAIGGDPLIALFRQAGINSHPVVVRALRAVGEMHSEDRLVTSRERTPEEPAPVANRMFKNSMSEFNQVAQT